jgi:hypothetical protein
MKKSTGIIFLVAAALAAFVYFYELKHNPPSETPGNTSKPAFSVSADDITGVTLERAGTTATFEHRPDGWYMLQPVATRADQSRLTGITSQIASLQTDRTFPVTAEQITSFGLDHPSITLAITMKNGSKHKLRFGGKDFSGSSVYVLLDEDTKNVSLIADTLLTTSDKGVEDLRDRAVLGVSAYDATSFDLVNPGGEIAAAKKDEQWTMQKPRAAAGDSNAITSLLETVNNAQITKFVSDSAADLGKYGLASPAIRFHSTGANGQAAELQIGKKDGGEYFARDASRPTIFRVNDALYKALNEKFGDLRDKQLVHFSEADISQLEVRNQNGTSQCVKSAAGAAGGAAGGAGGQLVLQPNDDKGDKGGKGAAVPCPFVAALEMARAQEIYDEPPAAIAGKLAKPPVQVTLTNVSGKKLEIQVSAPVGDSVYARTGGGPEIYKLEKKLFDDLNSKASP